MASWSFDAPHQTTYVNPWYSPDVYDTASETITEPELVKEAKLGRLGKDQRLDPIANKCFAVRMKICPCDTAGELSV